jgi:hypothetical protein
LRAIGHAPVLAPPRRGVTPAQPSCSRPGGSRGRHCSGGH